MANQVQIELSVDEKGAVSGIRNLDAAVAGTTSTVKTLGAEMGKAGAQAAAATTQMKAGFASIPDSVAQFNVRAKAAMDGYNAQSKRGIEVQRQLGAAFDAAMLQGKTFIEAQEAATAAVAAYVPAATAAAAATRTLGAAQAASTGHFQTSFDSVRLLRTELGVRMPRAMESVVARSGAMMGVISKFSGVLIGIGAAGIFVSLGEEIYHAGEKFYKAFLDVNGALKDYQEKASEAAQTKLFDDASLETEIGQVKEVNRQIDQLLEKKKNSTGFFQNLLFGNGFAYFSPKNQRQLNSLQTQQDQKVLEGIEGDYKERVRRSQNEQRIAEARAPQYARAKISEQYDERRADYLQEYLYRKDSYDAVIKNRGLAPKDQTTITADAGWRQAQQAKDDAQAKYDAAEIQRAREVQATIQQLREQALEAGLHGEDLYAAKEKAEIVELAQQGMASAAAIEAVHERYHKQAMERLQEEKEKTQEIQAQTVLAGWTGIRRIQGQGDIEIGGVRADNSLDEETKDERVKAIKDRVGQEIVEAQRNFADQVDAIAERSADRQASGFARIRMEATRQLDALQQEFDKTYGHLDLKAPGNAATYQQGLTELNRGKAAINSGANYDAAELARRNSEETLQIEAQAREKSLSAEKQKTAAIEAEYEERVRKYQDQLNQQSISQDDFNRRVVAAQQERDGEMIAEQRAAREKMAHELSGFFANPLDALKRMGDRAAGEAAATLTQHAQQGLERHAGGVPAADANSHSLLGDLIGSTTGMTIGGHRRQRAAIHPAVTDRAAETPASAIAATSSIFSVGTAQIHIGSASFVGGSGGVGAAAGAPARAPLVHGSYSIPGGLASGPTGAEHVGADRTAEAVGAGAPSLSAPASVGGAGSSTIASAKGGFTGSPGIAPAKGNITGSVLGDVGQSISLGQSAAGIFTDDKSGGNGNTAQTPASGSTSANGSPSRTRALLNKAPGAFEGLVGIYGAVESNGGVGGALSGAASGMKLGATVAGPVGAAIGAAAGAIVGAIGFGGREKAHVYDLKQIHPRLTQDMDSYEQGSMDYLSAFSDMSGALTEAKRTTNRMGPAARSYYQDTIKGEIAGAQSKLTREEKAGRSQFGVSAAQYETGTDFVPRTEMALVHRGERVVPSDQNTQIARALSAGADLDAIHRSYQRAMQAASSRSMGGGDRTLNMHVYAHDSRSVAQFFHANKHHMRAALNASYAENSGGADA